MNYIRILIISLLGLLFSVRISGQDIDLGNDILNQYWEKIELITDRNIYISGEKLWFYLCISANLDTVYSKTVYVELYNGEKIIQQKLSLENGFSKGYIQIPKEFSTSGYLLRAYTKYQKNFLPEHYAYQVVYVVNIEKGIPSIEKPLITERLSGFKSVVTSNSYSLIIDSSFQKTGILVTKEKNGQFKVDFSPYNGYQNDIDFKYVVRNSSFQVVKSGRFEKNNFSVPIHLLTGGYNYYVIYNDSVPFVFGVIYKYQQDTNLLINGEKMLVKTRSKINLPEFSDSNSQNTIISITRRGTKFSIGDSTLAYKLFVNSPYLINSLKNIFPGYKSIPKKYVKQAMKKHVIAIKNNPNLLAKIFMNSASFLPEIYDLSLEGEVMQKGSNLPVSDGLVYLSLFGSNSQLSIYKTLEDGSFLFNLENVTGIRNAFLTMDSVKSGNVDIQVKSNFSNDFYTNQLPMIIDTNYVELIEDLNLAIQIRNVFSVKDSSIAFNIEPIPSIARFGDLIVLKDFIDLPTLTDVFREIIPKATVRNRKGKQLFSITDERRMFVYDEPIVLLDNIPIFNYSSILSLNPSLVEKISVVDEPIYLGDFKIDGLISLSTYKGDFGEIDFSGNSSFLKYQTYTPIAQFMQKLPQFNNLPHFSNTLFWDGGVVNLTNLEISTDDGNGNYELHIYNIGESEETNSVYHAEIDVVINEELE